MYIHNFAFPNNHITFIHVTSLLLSHGEQVLALLSTALASCCPPFSEYTEFGKQLTLKVIYSS